MSKLFVIRHGMRIDHEDRSWKNGAARPFDPPLSPTGEDQARATGAYLKPEGVEAIYASPLLRTVQTGHAIAEALDLPLKLEGGLVEWLNPKWYDFSEGWLDPAVLKDDFPRLQGGSPQLVQPRFPEIEEITCKSRVHFVARQLATMHEGPIALITHGICVWGIVEGLTAGQGEANDKTCAVNVLQKEISGWKLEKSVVSHLDKQEETVSFI
ncbi:MAG: histidine phosphatase family protein [Ardenticatenaceae bacterium]|nr:histidine phosphatase family protein [Ardenticatenaceae bacterium]